MMRVRFDLSIINHPVHRCGLKEHVQRLLDDIDVGDGTVLQFKELLRINNELRNRQQLTSEERRILDNIEPYIHKYALLSGEYAKLDMTHHETEDAKQGAHGLNVTGDHK